MKLIKLAQKLLSKFSGIKEDLIKKYPEFEKDILDFISNDPSGNNKYLNWQIKMLALKQAPKEELIDIINLFDKFQDKLDKKDINQYSPNEAADLRIKLSELNEVKKQHIANKELITAGNKTIYKSDNVLVKLITNQEASQQYGKGTKWCISAIESTNYYHSYEADNSVIFIIFTKLESPNDKIAIVLERDSGNNIHGKEIFNALDNQIEDLPEELGSEKDIIYKKIYHFAEWQAKPILAKIKYFEDLSEKDVEDLKKINISNQSFAFKQMLLINEKLPYLLVEKLSDDNDLKVRQLVAQSTRFSDILEKLSNDKEQAVRKIVATNKNISNSILEKLSDDVDANVRANIARRWRITNSILEKLSNDVDKYVRLAVASNLNVLNQILEKLSNDNDSEVRYKAKEVLKRRST